MQKEIRNIKVGDNFEGYYILTNMTIKSVGGGRSTLMLGNLSDVTGNLGCKIWNYNGSIKPVDAGKVVYVSGTVGEYNTALQADLYEFRLAEPKEYEGVSGLVPEAPEPFLNLLTEMSDLINEIKDPAYKRIVQSLLGMYQTKFEAIPAGKTVHHAYVHGLLMHTVNVGRAAYQLGSIYREVINMDLLLAGALLHDIGKIIEFEISPVGLVSKYSVKGNLMGHMVLGAQEVAEEARTLGIPEDKSVLLQHLLLSHHGEPDFGAAVRPMCAEAVLLHFADNLDTRMEIYRTQLQKMQIGEVSDMIGFLGTRVYRHQ